MQKILACLYLLLHALLNVVLLYNGLKGWSMFSIDLIAVIIGVVALLAGIAYARR